MIKKWPFNSVVNIFEVFDVSWIELKIEMLCFTWLQRSLNTAVLSAFCVQKHSVPFHCNVKNDKYIIQSFSFCVPQKNVKQTPTKLVMTEYYFFCKPFF